MTDEQYKQLEEYEVTLRKATYENYMRGLGTPSLEKLNNLYKEIFNKDSRFLNGCSRCILHCTQELGRAYFQEKEIRENKKKKKNGKKEDKS